MLPEIVHEFFVRKLGGRLERERSNPPNLWYQVRIGTVERSVMAAFDEGSILFFSVLVREAVDFVALKRFNEKSISGTCGDITWIDTGDEGNMLRLVYQIDAAHLSDKGVEAELIDFIRTAEFEVRLMEQSLDYDSLADVPLPCIKH